MNSKPKNPKTRAKKHAVCNGPQNQIIIMFLINYFNQIIFITFNNFKPQFKTAHEHLRDFFKGGGKGHKKYQKLPPPSNSLKGT